MIRIGTTGATDMVERVERRVDRDDQVTLRLQRAFTAEGRYGQLVRWGLLIVSFLALWVWRGGP